MARAGLLDHRVRREAKVLVKEARAALGIKRGLKGKGGDLEETTAAMEEALAARDLPRVRRQLPVLDFLVDELVKRPPKSTARDYVESIGAAVLIALALRAFVVEAFKIPSSSMYPTLEIGDHIFVNKFIYGVRIPWTTTKFFELKNPQRGDVIVFIYPCDPERDYIKRVIATAGQTVEVRCNVVYVDGVPVPQKLVNPALKYEDQPEGSTEWLPTDVSLYQETVGDKTYSTYQDSKHPERERERALGTLADGDARDFPRTMHPPNCSESTDIAKNRPEQVMGEVVQDHREAEVKVCEPYMHYVVPPGHIFAMGDNRWNSNDSRVWGSVPIENVKGKALFTWLSYREFSPTHLKFQLRFDRIGNFIK